MRLAGISLLSDLFLFRAIVRTKERGKSYSHPASWATAHSEVVQKEIGGIRLPSRGVLTP